MLQGPQKPKDAISEELEPPNGFDGEEKTSHKSLPEVLGREEASDGVCCSWLVRAGLGQHSLSTTDKAPQVQGEEPTGVAGRGHSPRSPSEVASGLCQCCISSDSDVGLGCEGQGRRNVLLEVQEEREGHWEAWGRHLVGRPQGLERSLGVWELHSIGGNDAAGMRVELESHR